MTKKQEYQLQHEVRKDALGHDLRVGDLVIFHWWDRRVKHGKVVRFTPSWVQIEVYGDVGYNAKCPHIENRYADRVIKIKDDAIPDN